MSYYYKRADAYRRPPQRYRVSFETVTDENGQKHDTYGIMHRNNGTWEFIDDIFRNAPKAIMFVRKLNALDVSPLHVHDVVDDMLAEEATI